MSVSNQQAKRSYNLAFVNIRATDNVMLPALLYEPLNQSSKAAIWLHGMGDNGIFYKPERMNALGMALAERGIALLGLNNRGAHNQKKLTIADTALPEDERVFRGGTYYELIIDCVKDIDGAVQHLQELGYSELYVLGHSTGANKICVYDANVQQNPFSKYVLAGPGDDTGGLYAHLGQKNYLAALDYAAKAIQNDEPLKTLPKYTGMHPFSAQSTWDILDPEGAYNTFPYYEYFVQRIGEKPLFKEYRKLDKPTLVVLGENDEYLESIGGSKAALDCLLHHTSTSMLKKSDFQILPDADHSFSDHEVEFATLVADWLADV